MRIAVFVVAIVMVSSPSQASPSCMTLAEARAAFGNKHLWWHGPNRCWDATPGRRRLAERSKAKETRQAARDGQVERVPERAIVEEKKPPRWTHESRWREAMSRMLPEDVAALQQPSARAQASIETLDVPLPRFEMPAAPPRTNWRDRWVEVVPSVPVVAEEPAAVAFSTAAAPEVEPLLTPTRVILALLAMLLTLALVEILFRTTHRDWRR
jgi:hypothetical protein